MKRYLLILIVIIAIAPLAVETLVPTTARAAACTTIFGYGNVTVGANIYVNAGDRVTATMNGIGGTLFTVAIDFPGAVTVTGQGAFGTATTSGTATNSGPALVRFDPGGATQNFLTYTITICPSTMDSSRQPSCPIFFDGRLNNCTPWETAAIYCLGNGSVRVYVLGHPLWTIDLDASPEEIAKVSKHPDHNTLIKAGQVARLYRLSDGPLQINTPALEPTKGDYVFVFHDCPVP